MRRRRHKRKNSHVVIVTSDAVDARTKQIRIRPWIVETLVIILSAAIGLIVGYIIFLQDTHVETAGEEVQTVQQQETIAALEEEKANLQAQITELNSTVQILSETVIQKTERESFLAAQLDQQSIPTEFPLTGYATFEEVPEGDPMCIFTASSGAMVVATANGTVAAVNDDAEYGHNIWVDHGNGFVTVYRNKGEVKVKQGETVRQGSTLFLINDENSRLGYQMMRDGTYIDPMEMLIISG